MQLDRALKIAHESLRAICEVAESFRQRQQLRVQFGRIRLGGSPARRGSPPESRRYPAALLSVTRPADAGFPQRQQEPAPLPRPLPKARRESGSGRTLRESGFRRILRCLQISPLPEHAKRVLRFLLVTVHPTGDLGGSQMGDELLTRTYEDSKNRAVMLGFFNQRVPEYRMCPQPAFRVCQRLIFYIERSHKSVECGVVCNGKITSAEHGTIAVLC